jgi:hypothetical protein
MTTEQRNAVTAAQAKFFAAEDAATKADSDMAQIAAATDAAQRSATVDAPAQARKLVQDANDAFFKLAAQRDGQIQATQAAHAALGQAQLDLQKAISDSLQTGAVEMMPAPTPQH